MHCWKTINVKKQYGFNRIFTFALLTGLGVFTAFYVLLNIVYSGPLSDKYFLTFLMGVAAVYPLHKICHFMPLIGSRKCIKFIKKQHFIFPGFSLHVKEPVAKNRFTLALALPFLLINSIIILLTALFPAYIHYFALLLAYHCSLCLPDLIYMRHLARSPKYALIEETDTGFEILVPQVIA